MKKKILIVEDNSDYREIMNLFITKMGYRAIQAKNSHEAITFAETEGPVEASSSERERPRYGLIGMQERATALGGECTAGPTPSGWRVSCRLPVGDGSNW